MAFLELKEVSNGFGIKQVSLQIDQHERCAIIGETGSGKTSLLKLLGGLLQPAGGQVLFNGQKVEGPLERLIPGHPSIAYLSQHFELWNNYRVEEILQYKNDLSDEEAKQLFEICDIRQFYQRKTDQLSGGERQRVALARLLAGKPAVLLLDEPFSNLDRNHKSIMKKVIEDISTKLQITCVLVSHDATDTLPWASRVLVLQQGQIVQDAEAETVYFRPVNEYAAKLLGDYNLLALADGRKLFIRPEQIDISLNSEDASRKGIVVKSSFNGNYYLLEVDTGTENLQVQTTDPLFAKGMEVYLSFDEESWFI